VNTPNERQVVDRVAAVLLTAGAVIGTLAIGAWVLDTFSAMPSWTVDAFTRMPAWMLRLAVYKLTLGAGGGLVIAGAVIRRQMREAARREGASATRDASPELAAPGLDDQAIRRERARTDARREP
jgi:hypothetical protein